VFAVVDGEQYELEPVPASIAGDIAKQINERLRVAVSEVAKM
jgi:hypothetical protein